MQHATARWCQPTGAPKRGKLDAPLHAALLLGCRRRRHGRRSSLLLVAPPCRGTLVLCAVPAQSALQGGMARITSQASPICWSQDQGGFCCHQPDVITICQRAFTSSSHPPFGRGCSSARPSCQTGVLGRGAGPLRREVSLGS